MQHLDALRELAIEKGSQQPTNATEQTGLRDKGETQAIFWRDGNMAGTHRQTMHGLFRNDMRHLGMSRLLVNGEPPELVTPMAWNETATMATAKLRQGPFEITRRLVVHNNALHEQIEVVNTSPAAEPCAIAYACAGDFENTFVIRGGLDAARQAGEGTFSADAEGGLLHFRYSGFTDRVSGKTSPPLTTDLRFSSNTADALQVEAVGPGSGFAAQTVSLAPRQRLVFEVQAACRMGDEAPAPALEFDEAAKQARYQHWRLTEDFPSIEIADKETGKFFDTALRDFAFLFIDTEHGPYPAAGTTIFNCMFGRDGIISALSMGMGSVRLMQSVILNLLDRQASADDRFRDAKRGDVPHECRKDEMSWLGRLPFMDNFASADAAPLFLKLCGTLLKHLSEEEARAFFAPLMDKIGLVEQLIDSKTKDDGLIWFEASEDGSFAVKSWMDSQDSLMHADGSPAKLPAAVVEVQGYDVEALHARAALHRLYGRKDQAAALDQRGERKRRLINEKFWDPDLRTYVPAIDAVGSLRVVKSNAGHLLWSGIPDAERTDYAQQVIERLMEPDMFSGFVIRTMSTGEVKYDPDTYHNGSGWPHDTLIAAAGFARYGDKKAAAKVLKGVQGIFARTGTFSELIQGISQAANPMPQPYGKSEMHIGACKPQAWSAATPLLALQSLLGLEFDAAKNEIQFNRPYLPENFGGEITLRGLKLGGKTLDVRLTGREYKVHLEVLLNDGIDVVFEPYQPETFLSDVQPWQRVNPGIEMPVHP